MPEPSNLLYFTAATVVLLIIPGPAVLYIVARSLHQGRMAGVISTLDIAIGTLFHVAAAAAGVSALLMSSVLAFNAVKYLGAGYLMYLGVRTLWRRTEARGMSTEQIREMPMVFYQGILVNLLNPKTALFLLAFLPQFVDPTRGSATAQTTILGLLFVSMGIVSDSIYALLAGTFGNWLQRNARLLHLQRYFAGGVYLLLGVVTAFSGSHAPIGHN